MVTDEVHRPGEFATSVEQVMGRVTARRAGFLGAVLGAWLGMLAGLLLALFLPTVAWLPMLLGGMLVGAAAGAGIGLLTYSSTDGRRDFAGTTRPQAQRYAVEVAGSTDAAETARALING